MKTWLKLVVTLLAVIFLFACAATPTFDIHNVDPDITPQQSVTNMGQLQGTDVLWGGMIIASTNLANSTQLEILAYPLTNDQMPDATLPSVGRFLAMQDGYLETSDYAPGRLISIKGRLEKTHVGTIGESEYIYPMLRIEQHQLWHEPGKPVDSGFHFGIDLLLHN